MDFRVISGNLTYLLWGTFPGGPLSGAALTLVLSVVSALASGVLGVVLGISLSMSEGRTRTLLTLFLGFFRAIPVIMLIFWSYFLLPIAFGVEVPGLVSVTCALSLIGGAYLAHSVHAGISAIPRGQWSAGLSIGLTRVETLCHIILPQALRMMAPSFVNQWISLIKDTSLAYIVGVSELSFVASQVNSRVMVHPAEIFLFVGAIYFVLCTGLNLLVGFVNRRSWRRLPERDVSARRIAEVGA